MLTKTFNLVNTNFVRSGVVDLYNSFLRLADLYGYNWSATSVTYSNANSATTYNLDFGTSGLYSSAGPYNRGLGFPVRCLASGD